MNENQIVIYQTEDGQTAVDVKLAENTIWLTQPQIAVLFGTQRPAITKHLLNIFGTGELEESAVCSILEHTASNGRSYQTKYYNLDVILSIGYRISSKSATQFRIWANKVLKEYLTQGYALNEKRLNEQKQQFEDLKQTVRLMGSLLEKQSLSGDEASGLWQVITDYTYALDILDKYDHQRLSITGTSKKKAFVATYEDAMNAIQGLREKFGGSSLFGNEKDESFRGSIANIYQSFGGEDVYPSIEEKAAHLLYFVTKNHSFSDGNKRIAAFLFVWFMEKNGILYRRDGAKRLADNALVAITLMIAESKPDEKEVITQVVVNLINDFN